jgi:hypothetical protein
MGILSTASFTTPKLKHRHSRQLPQLTNALWRMRHGQSVPYEVFLQIPWLQQRLERQPR